MKRMKISLAVIGLLILSLLVIGTYNEDVAADSEGECGDDMEYKRLWTPRAQIVITGDGYMWDFDVKNGVTTAPWNEYEYFLVQWGEVKTWYYHPTNRMDSIGKYAFYGTHIIEIQWVDNGDGDGANEISLEYIDDWAFAKVNLESILGNRFDYTPVHFPYLSWMGEHVFYDCDSMKKADLTGAYNLHSIGDYAFADCDKLTTVILPDSVTEIGKYIFANCKNLKEVKLSPNISEIPEGAFKNCTNLQTIEITGSDITIGKDAFAGCSKLQNIIIKADSITLNDAFIGCSSLPDLTISAPIINLKDFAFDLNPDIQNLTLKGDVVNIGDNAFMQCDGLKSVNVQSSRTTIGEYVFQLCPKLEKVTLSQDELTIGIGAFLNDPAIKSLSLSASELNISKWLVSKCDKLENITLQAKHMTVDSEAFGKWGKGITILPWRDGSIHSESLKGVKNITSIVIGDSCVSIENSAFEGCSDLKTITIPHSVRTIGDYAFAGTALENISLDPSISIGRGLFSGCKSLKSADISGKETIPAETFKGCANLQNFRIPSNATSIGDYAFAGCTSLATANLSNIRQIGKSAFADTGLTSVVIEPGTDLGANCFLGSKSLKYLQIPIDVNLAPSAEDILFDCLDSLETVRFTPGSGIGCDYEKGMTAPMWQSVKNSNVKVTLDDTIEYIGAYAFEELKSLGEIVLPDFTSHIGEGAFAGCSGLSKVTAGYSISVINDGAFAGCVSLKEIINKSPILRMHPGDDYNGGISKYAETVHEDSDLGYFGDYFVIVNGTFDECLIGSYTGDKTGDFVLPSEFEVNGTVAHKVKISADVFKDADFSSITIGDNCLHIGKNAFFITGINLKNITVDSPGAYIAAGAFNTDYSGTYSEIESVVLAAGMTIDDDAFPDDTFFIGNRAVKGNDLAGHEWVNGDHGFYPSDMNNNDTDSDDSDTTKLVAAIAVLIIAVILVASVGRKH